MAAMVVGAGGAPPVAKRTGWSNCLPNAAPRIGDLVEHDRRSAEVADPMPANQIENDSGVEVGERNVRSADRGHRPGEAPAVAMKHGQGPQVGGRRDSSPSSRATPSAFR